jgi:hypothetical protein
MGDLMSSVIISGDTSGAITLAAPSVAGTYTQTLPMITGTLGTLNSGTAVASTSGTSIDFTNIPANVRRITVMLNGVSSNSTGNPQIQLSTSSTYAIASYFCSTYSGGAGASTSTTTGFTLFTSTAAAATYTGTLVLSLLDSNVWMANGSFSRAETPTILTVVVGRLSLGGTLNGVRLICSATGSPSDTFDAGTINILYE